MSHGTRINELLHIHDSKLSNKRVTTHTSTSHVTHMNESCSTGRELPLTLISWLPLALQCGVHKRKKI